MVKGVDSIRAYNKNSNAITKKGVPYKASNNGKVAGALAGLLASTKCVLNHRDVYINAGKDQARILKNSKLCPKAITGVLASCKIVPAILIGLGLGTIIDGVYNKIKASHIDRKI